MAELITWCRLMRVGPACATPCDDCRVTSGRFARAGVHLDPDRFYDDPPTTKETAMQTAIAQLAAKAKAARSLSLYSVETTVQSAEAAVAEYQRLVDAFERLAAVVSNLDFDATESAVPETQEHWIEFVRSLEERAHKVIFEVGDLA